MDKELTGAILDGITLMLFFIIAGWMMHMQNRLRDIEIYLQTGGKVNAKK